VDPERFESEKLYPPSLALPLNAKKAQMKKVVMIHNPHAGAEKGNELAEEAERLLTEVGVKVKSIPTEHKGHCEELCKSLDLRGIDAVVAVGGDGTIHECVNGLMQREDEERLRIPLAVIPAGTGNSFVRELYGGVEVPRAVNRILRGIHCPIDVAKIICKSKSEETLYSFNSIHWGLGSKVIVTAEKLRWMGKAVRYTTASLLEMVNGEDLECEVLVEDASGKKSMYIEKFSLLISNNISSAMAMKIAPNAKINDGLMDLVLVRSSSAVKLATFFSKIYSGTHPELEFVEYEQVRYLEVNPKVHTESKTEEMLDVDGELRGSSPFSCAVIPGAIRVIL
jgi:sphingosine kinase